MMFLGSKQNQTEEPVHQEAGDCQQSARVWARVQERETVPVHVLQLHVCIQISWHYWINIFEPNNQNISSKVASDFLPQQRRTASWVTRALRILILTIPRITTTARDTTSIRGRRQERLARLEHLVLTVSEDDLSYIVTFSGLLDTVTIASSLTL